MVKKRSGSRGLALPTGSEFNELAESANYINRNLRPLNPVQKKKDRIARDIIPFVNKTGDRLITGQVIGLDDASIQPTPSKASFLNDTTHNGVLPTFRNHRFRSAIVKDSCPNDAVGEAILSGVASTYIDIKAEHVGANQWRPFASLKDGEVGHLQSDPSGEFQIIWTETGGASHNKPTAGVQEARVIAGSHYDKMLPATVGPTSIQSGNGGVIRVAGVDEDTIGYWTHGTNGNELPAATPVWVQRADDGMYDIIAPSTSGGASGIAEPVYGEVTSCGCQVLFQMRRTGQVNPANGFSREEIVAANSQCGCSTVCGGCFMDDEFNVTLNGISAGPDGELRNPYGSHTGPAVGIFDVSDFIAAVSGTAIQVGSPLDAQLSPNVNLCRRSGTILVNTPFQLWETASIFSQVPVTFVGTRMHEARIQVDVVIQHLSAPNNLADQSAGYSDQIVYFISCSGALLENGVFSGNWFSLTTGYQIGCPKSTTSIRHPYFAGVGPNGEDEWFPPTVGGPDWDPLIRFGNAGGFSALPYSRP